MDISSFTAASTLPKKLIGNKDIVSDIINHNIKPVHIQLNPTNKCPLNCSFCSCKNRNKDEFLSLDELRNILTTFKDLGTKAVTITGGGDPLAYPYFKDMLNIIKEYDMVSGLVTNGVLFNTIDKTILNKLTWCRISVSDEQLLLKHLNDIIKENVQWAFSYVLNKKETNYDNLINCINFANKNKFTHVRLVDNIIDYDNNENNMINIKKELIDRGIDDSIVIYQGRKKHTKGNKRCFISLLKPNISPSGKMLPCCGIQYAFENPGYDFEKDAIMNKNESYEDVYNNQKYFDGSKCVRCYYSDYNDIMNILWDSNKLEHKEFV